MRIEAELRPNRQGNAEFRPEFADIGRVTRRLVTRTIGAARAEEASAGRLIAGHIGPLETPPSVAKATWQAYDRVNVQTGVNAWLAEPGRTHTLTGLVDYRHRDLSLPDLMRPGRYGAGLGSVESEALPAGPGGQTLPCVQIGLYLARDDDGTAVILLRGPEEHGSDQVHLEVACADQDRAQEIVAAIRRLSEEHNVFRGHVIEFGGEVFGYHRGSLLSFVDRPKVSRDEVVLGDDVLDGIERQVLGVAKHAHRLLASGQHLRRGVLLYGVPGTGKTHTLRYLLSRLPGVTAVMLSGRALGMIGEACSVARALQPCLIVVEDVDLIAEERDHYEGGNSLLFELLNEMDGIGQDIDVTFLLTTNRADMLEEALAARPGRVDHAVELPVPDADARARLIKLYQANLELALTDLPTVIARTEGVTASFIKELLRRAALAAAEADPDGPADAPIRVTDEHMSTALDQLLDTRSRLTQVLLGGRRQSPESAGLDPAEPMS
jgi:ATPase family associated with various cellular activities (AAA)